MQSVRSGRNGTRPRRRTRNPAPVSVTFRCATCAGPHPTSEHALAEPARDELRTLDAAELRVFRADALEELLSAVRGDAGLVHIAGVVRVIEAIDARLERLDV